MRSAGASGREPKSVSSDCCVFATGSVSGSDEAMDIRLRLGERPSWKPSGGDDSGTSEESSWIDSGSVFHVAGGAVGEPSSGDTGELSSMMSWVERFLDTLDLMANAGVAKGAPVWVADGLGVEAANRGVE